MHDSTANKLNVNEDESAIHDLDALTNETGSADLHAASSKALTELEKQLQSEKDKRKEDFFLCVLLIVVLINGYIFSHVDNWAGAIVIGMADSSTKCNFE
jgi:hypothetical protein